MKNQRNEISAYDFFFKFTENIRLTQVKIMKIIYTYNQIHECLLQRMILHRSSKRSGLGFGFSDELKKLIKQLYPFTFKGSNFDTDYEALCQNIILTYYNK
jgi:hypothetical protein